MFIFNHKVEIEKTVYVPSKSRDGNSHASS
jgi:hypothetical protein